MQFDQVVKQVTETIQREGNSRAVFGEPVKLDTHVVIPVASITVIGGGGGGTKEAPHPGNGAPDKVGEEAGGGGGLSMRTQPVGFIHEQDGKVIFTAIEMPNTLTFWMSMPKPIMKLVDRVRHWH